MKKYLYLVTLHLMILFSFNAFAEQNWKFVKDTEYCYIQSVPAETEIPEGKTRGQHGILVYTMHKNPDLVVQITAGFDYKSSDTIKVQIDEGEYSFYTDSDTAWAKDDKKVIYAMKKGLKLITTGISSKGTTVIDTYTLKGFTSAIKNLSDSTDC